MQQLNNITPQEFCEMTKLCKPPKLTWKRNDCATCQFVILEIKLKLQDPKVQVCVLDIFISQRQHACSFHLWSWQSITLCLSHIQLQNCSFLYCASLCGLFCRQSCLRSFSKGATESLTTLKRLVQQFPLSCPQYVTLVSSGVLGKSLLPCHLFQF